MSNAAVSPHEPSPADVRLTLVRQWLATIPGCDPSSLTPASADASFRRYFRVAMTAPQADGPSTAIVMDAPPDKEPLTAFLQIGEVLRSAGLRAPEIFAQSASLGFLLLEDFGNTTLLQRLADTSANPSHDAEGLAARPLYAQAWRCLIRAQDHGLRHPDGLKDIPAYDHGRLMQELRLFPEWYLARHVGVTLTPQETKDLEAVFERLIDRAIGQLQVFVHRDFHSRNLMVLDHLQDLGVLDFQDALVGPVTYDLVSLLRDAYLQWPEAVQIDWAARYWQEARAYGVGLADDFGTFYADFEWMGLQRHLKVLGIFARLSLRDGKHGYLNDIPRVLSYAQKTAARYDELAPLGRLLQRASGQTPQTQYTF